MWPNRTTWAELFYTCLVLWTLEIGTTSGNVKTYYCSRFPDTTLIHAQEGRIRTVLPHSLSHVFQKECQWKIQAKQGYQIQVTVLPSDLPQPPKSASTCDGYDHVDIFDAGGSGKPVKIVTWCRNQDPISVISKGSHVFIKFKGKTTDSVQFGGIYLSFTAFHKDGPNNTHLWVIVAICIILAIIAIVLAVLVIYRRCFQRKKPEEQLVRRQRTQATPGREIAAVNDIDDLAPQARFSRSPPPAADNRNNQNRPLDGTVVLQPLIQDNQYQSGNLAGSSAQGPPPSYDNEMAMSYNNIRPIQIVPSTGTYNIDRPPQHHLGRHDQRQGEWQHQKEEAPPQYNDIYPRKRSSI